MTRISCDIGSEFSTSPESPVHLNVRSSAQCSQVHSLKIPSQKLLLGKGVRMKLQTAPSCMIESCLLFWHYDTQKCTAEALAMKLRDFVLHNKETYLEVDITAYDKSQGHDCQWSLQ